MLQTKLHNTITAYFVAEELATYLLR